MVLQRGCGCVREEDRPLISCFLSLGKGGVLRCCPCFLMSALETTETNPLQLDQRYTFLPMVHFTHLNLFVPKGLAAFFSYLCHSLSFSLSLQALYSPSLAAWSPTLQQQQVTLRELEGSVLFSLEILPHNGTNTHTHTKLLPRYWRQSHNKMPHYCSNVPSKTSIHSSLSSYRGGFNLKL